MPRKYTKRQAVKGLKVSRISTAKTATKRQTASTTAGEFKLVMVRLPAKEARKLTRAAKAADKPLSTFLREAALGYIELAHKQDDELAAGLDHLSETLSKALSGAAGTVVEVSAALAPTPDTATDATPVPAPAFVPGPVGSTTTTDNLPLAPPF